MAPAKRKARRREPRPQPASNNEISTSSPNRPSHKKRKVKGGRVSARFQSTSPDPVPEEYHSDTSETSEPNANKELVDSVVSYLSISKEAPGVLRQHGNDLSPANNEQKVSAYAKLSGKDWTYFILEQVTYLGRTAEDDERGMPHRVESSPAGNAFMPHIDLGPSKFVSRKHASISYEDSDAEGVVDPPEESGWHLRVGGRNGVKLNTALVKKGGRQRLKSGDVIDVHGTQMMFVLPNEEAIIHPFFIEKAKQAAAGEESVMMGVQDQAPSHAHPEPDNPSPTANSFLSTNGQIGQPPLAPAPPGVKRATTPPRDRMTDMSASQNTPAYNRGVVMETTQDVDYSLDSAKDLKPPFSYATLIAQAIFSDPDEQRSLASIYQWIMDRYAFYRHSTGGWQNSIRHNLSLSKAFEKVPRKTNEPGKGMKWRVHPDARADQLKKLRGKATSSGPNSPAGLNISNPHPNFRGPNGQPLGYDSSYAGQFQLNEPLNDPQRSQPQMSTATSPVFSSQQPREAFTPDRSGNAQSRRNTLSGDVNDDGTAFDDSPLPPNRRPHPPPFALSAQSPPTLSSSYLDTPFQGHSTNMITPAPQRRNVQLAPPSTLVAPSKFMPESSPAGPGSFPFFMGKLGATPAGPLLPDISPLKKEDDVNGPHAMSSSPPPIDSGSPSKKGRGTSPSNLGQSQTSSATKRESPRNSVELDGRSPPPAVVAAIGDDDEDGGGGFDLARGFQPIGSFTAPRSQSSSQPPAASAGRAGIGSRA